jgi:tripartite-type tricarboxylate transporter receptor subunit TctC
MVKIGDKLALLQFHPKKGEFMIMQRFVVWMVSVGLIVLCAGAVSGQNYPNRPVHILTAEPGGSSDFVARQIAQGLTVTLGQQVVVENRGVLAIEAAAKAQPDGHTLVVYTSPLWLSPFLRDNVRWDPVKDFSPIVLAANSPSILVVHPSLPVNSVKELIDLARARPGEINYASGSVGSTSHLAAELFNAMAGINIVHVPYKGAGPAVIGLIGGHVQVMFTAVVAGMLHVKSGKLRALAVTSAQPTALAPGLPTIAASGLPGYECGTLQGLFAPARTSPSIVNRLNQDVVRILISPEVKERFVASGVEAIGSSPEQLAATIKSEMAKWGKLIKDTGIREK